MTLSTFIGVTNLTDELIRQLDNRNFSAFYTYRYYK